MSFIREYQYSNVAQRKIIEYNYVLSFILLSLIFTDLYFSLSYYCFYSSVITFLVILGFGGLFIGTILGKFLYSHYGKFRIIYIVSELLFILLSLVYLLRDAAFPWLGDAFCALLFSSSYVIPIVIGIASILFGIKINYSSRVAFGDYIDKKLGIERFVGFLFLGLTLGIILAGLLHSYGLHMFFLAPVPLMIVPSIFMINLPYNPETQYARTDEDEKKPEPASGGNRRADTPFFTYLNFLYLIMYGYIGNSVIARVYGDLVYVKLAFIALLFIMVLAGYGAGRFLTLPRVHVFGQSFLPVMFLMFLVMVMSYGHELHFLGGMLLFAPAALLMGLLLYHSIRAVCAHYDSRKRASIIEFATFILPPPVIISLSLIDVTNLWFHVVIAAVMLMSVVIPAIFMVNSSIGGAPKALYFFFSILVIPVYIFIILFFKIPLDNGVYVTRVKNFEVLRDVNYNADYIRAHSVITMNSMPVFNLTDSVVRNYRRALVPLALYHPEDEAILFIDGNQRFFRNPVIGYFKNAVCLDEMSDRDVDFNKLPYSGTQRYVPDNDPILLYFKRSGKTYYSIVDIPNLLDQSLNSFRFSAGYYGIVKKMLGKNGLFVQVFNVPECRPELFSAAITNVRHAFSFHQVFFFSNILVVISSNGNSAFAVNQESYTRLALFYSTHEELAGVFQNEAHIASHLLYTGLDSLLPVMQQGEFRPGMALFGQERLRFKKQMYESYVVSNRNVLSQFEKSVDDAFTRTLALSFQNEDAVLTLLKKTELAEARGNYPEETRLMFELKKQAEFKITLQDYVRKMLAYKEKYYYHAAVQLEKDRKWTEAQELYRAVLAINPDNFEANYRMGILCITLQDIEGSFKYLTESMRINGDHPRVLYQMGILYFSAGKTEDAISYFDRALRKNEKLPSIYRYLGLCHDKLGNLYDAEKNYARAVLADPNDVDTKARLDDIRSRIEKENRKWEMPEQKNEAEVEQDAEMPLPVSKGAYDVRLKDTDETLPVIDPITGEEIQTDKAAGETGGGNGPRAEQPQNGAAVQK